MQERPIEKEDYEDCQCRPCTATAPVHPARDIRGTRPALAGRICDNPALLSRFHHRVGVDTRYFVMPLDGYVNLTRWGDANRVWLEKAEELGEAGHRPGAQRAGMEREPHQRAAYRIGDGDREPFARCAPGEPHGVAGDIRRTPIFGLGCVAGAAGIAQAADYVRAYPDRMAVLLSVELCSLTWQRGDLSIANLISSGLFGDGAAAVVVAGDDVVADGPEIVDTASSFYPTRKMRWAGIFPKKDSASCCRRRCLRLSARNLPGDVDAFLSRNGLTRSDVGSWVLHTGGPKVLDAMADVARAGSRNVRGLVGFAARRGKPLVRFCAAGAGGDYAEP